MSDSNKGTRWVLGFDGGCLACTTLARQVEALSAGKLTARNLREPEVREWRARTLGADAAGTPTLFAVADGRVRAWRGLGMAWQLNQLLGPSKLVQIARLLGEDSASAGAAPDQGRRRFLRTVGGAALGLTMLTGVKALGPLAAVAAGEDPLTVEVADEKTRARMLKRAERDEQMRLLIGHLQTDGFSPSAAPNVLVARQRGRIVRTMVAVDYDSRVAGRAAALVYGLEADDRDWADAIVSRDGELEYILFVGDGGTVETVKPGEVVAPLSTASCNFCQALCNIGGCGLGCFAATALVCAGNPVCIAINSYICRQLCALGSGVPCSYGCLQIGACP